MQLLVEERPRSPLRSSLIQVQEQCRAEVKYFASITQSAFLNFKLYAEKHKSLHLFINHKIL